MIWYLVQLYFIDCEDLNWIWKKNFLRKFKRTPISAGYRRRCYRQLRVYTAGTAAFHLYTGAVLAVLSAGVLLTNEKAVLLAALTNENGPGNLVDVVDGITEFRHRFHITAFLTSVDLKLCYLNCLRNNKTHKGEDVVKNVTIH